MKIRISLFMMLLIQIIFTACDEGSSGTGSENPTVITFEIAGNYDLAVDITGSDATGGGYIVSEGASPVIDRGVCWSETENPTIDDNRSSIEKTPRQLFMVTISGISLNTTYHVRAFAVNSNGTGYGADVVFNSGFTIDSEQAGGYVVYNDGFGGGLVVGKNDFLVNASYLIQWSGGGSTANTESYFGSGQSNTEQIVYTLEAGDYAAHLCNDYNDGTYSDWFLPSKDELYLIYLKNKNRLNSSSRYWSSSVDIVSSQIWTLQWPDGSWFGNFPTQTYRVRPVRIF